MKNSNYIKITAIIIFFTGFYFYNNWLGKRDERRYYEFYNLEVSNVITYSDTYRAYSIIYFKGSNKTYCFISTDCDTEEIIFDERPILGDSIFKKAFNDTIRVFNSIGTRTLCLFNP